MAQQHDHHDEGHGGHHHNHPEDREWSDEEIERMILTGLVVLVAALLSYLFGVYLPARRKRAAASAATAPPTPRQARQRRTREEGGGGGVGGAGGGGGGGGVLPSSTPPVRLVDGVMPFSYLRAHREQLDEHRRKQQRDGTGGAAPAQGSGSAFAPVDPREARRLLQRLSRLSRRSSPSSSSSASGAAASSSSAPSPPSAVSMSAKRGALAVVTVRRRELEGSEESRCATRDVLHLLGSVCNLFVILSPENGGDEGGSDSKSSAQEVEREVERFKDRLYGSTTTADGETTSSTAAAVPGLLHEAYVPRHRLVACSSPVGRIAFVRQLRPEWTLDYDPTVRDQLGRFGFHVILYGENASDADDDGEGTCGTLGDLIPRTAEAGRSASAAAGCSDADPAGGHEKQE